MGIFGDCGADGGVLGHLPEAVRGLYQAGLSALTIVGMLVSFGLLSQAMKTLPLGTAYGIWTGIGALGAVVVGLVLFKEPATAGRWFFRRSCC